MKAPSDLVREYRRRGLVVDSNLLLLFVIGSFERRQIETNDRLATYTQEDFDVLVGLLDQFRPVLTTPNILTEVSNLSNAIVGVQRGGYFLAFAKVLQLLQEEYVPSASALNNQFSEYGLTDAGIAEIAKGKYLVLTDDFRLSQSLQAAGIDTLNFNHVRFWAMSH